MPTLTVHVSKVQPGDIVTHNGIPATVVEVRPFARTYAVHDDQRRQDHDDEGFLSIRRRVAKEVGEERRTYRTGGPNAFALVFSRHSQMVIGANEHVEVWRKAAAA